MKNYLCVLIYDKFFNFSWNEMNNFEIIFYQKFHEELSTWHYIRQTSLFVDVILSQESFSLYLTDN